METTASFRLFGDARLTAAAVTRRLGVEPTRTHEVGDRVSRRVTRTHDSSLWLLASSSGVEQGTELGAHLRRLLDVLEPVAGPVWELVTSGYEANWYCAVASHATEHATELDRGTLQRLLAMPGDLWLDVWGDDVDE